MNTRQAALVDEPLRASFSLELVPRAILEILERRGIQTEADILEFLEPNYAIHTHDPFLFEDMERSVQRIIRAIFEFQKVTIYGDYDIDGVSSSVLLYEVLKTFGVSVDVHINHREKEGYGLQAHAIEQLAHQGTKLLITTDSGISNKDEIALANELGMEVIITDHHTVPQDENDIPPAYAILHPLVRADRYPFKHLSGGGVAFKLAQGLIRADFDEHFKIYRSSLRNANGELIHWEAYEKWLLDLVCLSTVGDCMPIVGENRLFVKYGLLVLAKTRRMGLRALIDGLRSRIKKFTTETIGFLIGPRINAASRMEHGKLAFDLLIADNERKALVLAQLLEEKNALRQKLTEKVFDEAKKKVLNSYEAEKKILIAAGDDWPVGILGLVAGKICNLYKRPVVLMTKGHGGIAGAARSVDGFHITDAFEKVSQYFQRYGGHKAAGGFALKDAGSIDEFTATLEEVAQRDFVPAEVLSDDSVDAEIALRDITIEFWDWLKRCEPFGRGNACPRFRIRACTVTNVRAVGSNNKHLKLSVQQDGILRSCIGFSLGEWSARLSPGKRVDIICEVDENEWMGNRELQLKILDLQERI